MINADQLLFKDVPNDSLFTAEDGHKYVKYSATNARRQGGAASKADALFLPNHKCRQVRFSEALCEQIKAQEIAHRHGGPENRKLIIQAALNLLAALPQQDRLSIFKAFCVVCGTDTRNRACKCDIESEMHD